MTKGSNTDQALADSIAEQLVDTGMHALGSARYHAKKILDTAPKEQGMLVSDATIPASIHTLLHDQARAYDCLFDDRSNKRQGETSRMRDLRLARVQYVKGKLAGVQLVHLPNRKLRNALAHFDEHLMKALLDHPVNCRASSMAIWSLDQIKPEPNLYQILTEVYAHDTDTVHMFENTLHLKPLVAEIDQVAAALGFEFFEN